MTPNITVSIIVHAQRHMSSSESLITSYLIFVIVYLMVVVFQFHTCTHPNFTSFLEQQIVSPCELMIANEVMYAVDANKYKGRHHIWQIKQAKISVYFNL